MIYDIAELAKQVPDAKHLTAPALYSFRPKLATVDPTALTAGSWRTLVAKAPIVRNCISTLILQLIAVPLEIVCEDEDKKAYYESVFDHANDEDFDTFLVRLIQDTLTVPFGGAFEPLRYSDGTLYNIYHVDGGTLFPTYDEKVPYVQVDPRYTHNRIYFAKDELLRVSWLMRPDIQNYGWSYTPAMDCYSAVESLIRTDIFYNTLLSDTPPPGILDLLDMSREEAEEWTKSFRLTFEGIDRFKIPVLYDHEKEAKWIPFQESATLKELPSIIRRYAEIVCSAFGMSIVDLGLYEYSQTKAGSTVQIETSKRQGLGSLMGRIRNVFNGRLLPDDVEFKWNPVDEEDRVQRATAQKLRVEAVAKGVELGIIDTTQAQKMLVAEGIFVIEMPEVPTGVPEVQGEEETEGEPPQPQGEEEMSLYGLVIDDSLRVRYVWEECEGVEHSEPTDSNEKSYVRMGKLFGRAFQRISKRLSLGLISRAVDAVWDDFPEPEAKALSYDTRTFARIQAIIASNGNLTMKEIAEIQSILGEAYLIGLESATDNAWNALVVSDTVKGNHGIAFSIENPETMRMLEQNAITLAGNVDQGTLNLVSRLIYTGVRDGKAVYGGKKSIAATIHQALPDIIGKRRARSIALFEVNKIQSEAHRKEYQTMGLQRKHWVSISAVACDLCKQNDARGFIGMEETFETVFGPAQGPPGHPQVCHCRIEFERSELMDVATGANAIRFWNGSEIIQREVGI